METQIDKRAQEKFKNKLPKKYVWNSISALKKNKKGRTKGKIVTVVKKEMEEIKIRKVNYKIGRAHV